MSLRNRRAKAISIAAALELGRRRQIAMPEKKMKIRSSQQAYDVLGPLLVDLLMRSFGLYVSIELIWLYQKIR